MDTQFQKTKDFAQHLDDKLTDPVDNPLRSAKRAVEATSNVVSQQTRQISGPHSRKAQKIVFAKGVFDVLLSLSLLFFPWLLYDGLIPSIISKITTLPVCNSHRDPQSAFGLAALIMGAGIAGISAAESSSDDAFRVIATLNGVFAGIALLGCLLSPYTFGSSFLLLAGLQDVFWFTSIVRAGKYDPFETLGLSWKAVAREEGVIRRREENELRRSEKKEKQREKREADGETNYPASEEVDHSQRRTTSHIN